MTKRKLFTRGRWLIMVVVILFALVSGPSHADDSLGCQQCYADCTQMYNDCLVDGFHTPAQCNTFRQGCLYLCIHNECRCITPYCPF